MKIRAMGFLGLALLGAASSALAQGGPFKYHAVTPCRVYDSRSDGTNGPLFDSAGTVGSGDVRAVNLRANHTVQTPGCSVPATATAVTANFTVAYDTIPVSFQKLGHIRVYPGDGTLPNVSTMNWIPSGVPLANGAIVPLSASTAPDMNVRMTTQGTGPGKIQIIIDVTGYFDTN